MYRVRPGVLGVQDVQRCAWVLGHKSRQTLVYLQGNRLAASRLASMDLSSTEVKVTIYASLGVNGWEHHC